MGTGYDVVLVRHGETLGYGGDLGLTERGEAQARARGAALAAQLTAGTTVRLPHARSARGTATAVALRAALIDAVVEGVAVGPLYTEPWFDNLRMSLPDGVHDTSVAATRRREQGGGPPPSWLVEFDRFGRDDGRPAALGGPIDFWVGTPTLFLEPPHLTAHRTWRGVVTAGHDRPDALVVVACTHSGLLRSFAASAFGVDPGEPDHLEEVRVRMHGDGSACVRFRDHEAELDAPPALPPWIDARWLATFGRR